MIKLYGYFRSSTSYRVRIALHLKKIAFEPIPIHLLRSGGEQHHLDFLRINPQALVPVLEDNGVVISQSLAIIEYLDERYPDYPLLPTDPALRARVRQLALMIACEMHPLCNLRVQNYLSSTLALSDQTRNDWSQHWIRSGLSALEANVVDAKPSQFCVTDQVTLADCCLIPQLANARRFHVDVTPFPKLLAIEQRCLTLPAFQQAHPDMQIDAEPAGQ
ncbi:MAG: maleylacetoacetate isomerase [Ottowia sp.]|nr:maleylacetoacetate isomerase [Ottowia sp.]